MKTKLLWFRLSIGFGVLLGLLLLAQPLATYHYVSRNLVRQEAGREAGRRMQAVSRVTRQAGNEDSAKLGPALTELVKEDPDQIAWIRILNMEGKVLAATDGATAAPTYKTGEISKLMANRDRVPAEVSTKSGTAVVILTPNRFGGPPGFGRGDRPPDAPPGPTGPSGPTATGVNLPDLPPVPPAGAAPAPGPTFSAAPVIIPPDAPNGRNGGRGRGGRRPLEVAEIGILLDGVSTNFGPLQTNLIVGCAAALALLGAMLLIALRFRGYMRSKHIEEELSVARRVQSDLFPNDDSIASRLGFAARCVPAYQVGGDLYDVFETDDGEVALILGDVSGKGLPAALLMGVVQGAVRASVGTGAAVNHEQAAERLNHLLCMKTARERFVSLFWCYYDRERGSLRYINAGHLPPLLVRRTAQGTQVLRLDEGGPVLGLLPGVRYRQATIDAEPGDLLVVFSDGILEAANEKDEEFGEEGIAASIERHWSGIPTEICSSILEDVRLFLGTCSPQDDQTLLVVKLDPISTAIESAQRASVLTR